MVDLSSPVIFVVSDGRGDTCNQVLEAALVQFPDQPREVVRWPEVRTAEEVALVVGAAAARDAIIFYTLVSDETRSALKHGTDRLLVPVVDLLGPAFSALHDVFKSEPAATPGLFYASDRERFDRHAAIDFTLKHDDGQRPDDLDQADVVIVGVSRASKSTTCFYLAYQGVKAANVPLIPTVQPPEALCRLDPSRVIGLRHNITRLMTVREARAVHLGHAHTGYYVDKQEIVKEVRYANHLMDTHGWRTIDASYLAVEEIAQEIVRLCGLTTPGDD